MNDLKGKYNNKYKWDLRRKAVALVAALLVLFFVVSLASQIFIYAFAM